MNLTLLKEKAVAAKNNRRAGKYDASVVFDFECEANNPDTILALVEALEIALGCLEFYADIELPGTWSFRKQFMFDMIDETDLEELPEEHGPKKRKYVVGGLRARQAREAIKAKIGDEGI